MYKRQVSGKQFTDGEIFREGTFKEDVVLDLNKEIGRYVRIIAKGAGECPATVSYTHLPLLMTE